MFCVSFSAVSCNINHGSFGAAGGKRLIAVDPGMRDIVTAVAMDVNTQAALQKNDGVRVTMKTSNKQFTRSSWRKKTQLLTTNEQKRIDVDEEGLRRFKARLNPAKTGPKRYGCCTAK